MSAQVQIDRLSAVADRYDAFLIDLWGVIHDGVAPFPGVPECLDALKRAGKRVGLLSNAPRRLPAGLAKLQGMGLGEDRFDFLYTSGEATFEALNDASDPTHASLGARIFHIGPDRDRDIFDGLIGRHRVDRPKAADFVLNTGLDAFEDTAEMYADVLKQCAEAGLPMVCANPDLVVMVQGTQALCAGELARIYEAMGQRVIYHGKPHAPVFDRCLGRWPDIDPRRVAMIGDSLRTDMAGARQAGIDGLFITGGIHRAELGAPWGDPPDAGRLAMLIGPSGTSPAAILPRLVW